MPARNLPRQGGPLPVAAPGGAAVGASMALLACLLAGTAAAREGPAVELLAPQPGARLVAGSWSTLAWSAADDLEGRGVEEWEAFLSFDGGTRYPVRLTPHSDARRSAVTFRVPDLPTAQARILLRFGDEVREVAWEMPGTFSIVASPSGVPAPAVPAVAAGEAPREGEEGVVAWVEGRRDGSHRREMAVPVPHAELAGLDPPAGRASEPAEESELPRQRLVRPAAAPFAAEPTLRPTPRPPVAAFAGAAGDVRLRIGRQNE